MAMIGMSGCQQAEEIKSKSEELRMSIEASIGKDGAVSGRTSLGNDGNVSFVDEDAIGLFVNTRSVVEWTYDVDDKTWEADGDIYWDNTEGEHQFYAFYPYAGDATLTNVPMPGLTIQTGDMDDIDEYDFLYATKVQKYSDGNPDGVVSFSGEDAFEHVFSLITITLQGEGDLLGSAIDEITISGEDIVTPYAFSFDELGVVSISDDEDDGEDNGVDDLVLSLTDCVLGSEGHTFYFVVNAGASLEDVDLSIRYTKGDDEAYVATLEGMDDNDSSAKFESGKRYSYALKVMEGVLSISGNSIKGWDNGVEMDDIIINGNKAESESES